jgi:hypothetical protein
VEALRKLKRHGGGGCCLQTAFVCNESSQK